MQTALGTISEKSHRRFQSEAQQPVPSLWPDAHNPKERTPGRPSPLEICGFATLSVVIPFRTPFPTP